MMDGITPEECLSAANKLRKMVETGWWRDAPKKIIRAAELLERVSEVDDLREITSTWDE